MSICSWRSWVTRELENQGVENELSWDPGREIRAPAPPSCPSAHTMLLLTCCASPAPGLFSVVPGSVQNRQPPWGVWRGRKRFCSHVSP